MKAIIEFPCPTIGVCGETLARRKCLLRLHAYTDEWRRRYPCLRRRFYESRPVRRGGRTDELWSQLSRNVSSDGVISSLC